MEPKKPAGLTTGRNLKTTCRVLRHLGAYSLALPASQQDQTCEGCKKTAGRLGNAPGKGKRRALTSSDARTVSRGSRVITEDNAGSSIAHDDWVRGSRLG